MCIRDRVIISSLRSSRGENIRVFNSEIPFSVRAAECSLAGESIFSQDKNGKLDVYKRQVQDRWETEKDVRQHVWSRRDVYKRQV